ncbi:MAG: rod-binding protein [Lachnospiraceae bacterium]
MNDLTNLSAYTNYMTDANRVAAETLQKNLQNVQNTRSANGTDKTKEDDALFDACKQFEAYLWEQVYKEMQKTVDIFSDDEDGYASQMVDYFKDSVIQQISAQTATQGSNSLAQMLYEQAKINYNIT